MGQSTEYYQPTECARNPLLEQASYLDEIHLPQSTSYLDEPHQQQEASYLYEIPWLQEPTYFDRIDRSQWSTQHLQALRFPRRGNPSDTLLMSPTAGNASETHLRFIDNLYRASYDIKNLVYPEDPIKEEARRARCARKNITFGNSDSAVEDDDTDEQQQARGCIITRNDSAISLSFGPFENGHDEVDYKREAAHYMADIHYKFNMHLLRKRLDAAREQEKKEKNEFVNRQALFHCLLRLKMKQKGLSLAEGRVLFEDVERLETATEEAEDPERRFQRSDNYNLLQDYDDAVFKHDQWKNSFLAVAKRSRAKLAANTQEERKRRRDRRRRASSSNSPADGTNTSTTWTQR